MWRKKREPTIILPLNAGGQLVVSQIQEREVAITVNEVWSLACFTGTDKLLLD